MLWLISKCIWRIKRGACMQYILYIPVGDDFAVLVFLVVLLRLIGMLDDIVGLNKAGVRTID